MQSLISHLICRIIQCARKDRAYQEKPIKPSQSTMSSRAKTTRELVSVSTNADAVLRGFELIWKASIGKRPKTVSDITCGDDGVNGDRAERE